MEEVKRTVVVNGVEFTIVQELSAKTLPNKVKDKKFVLGQLKTDAIQIKPGTIEFEAEVKANGDDKEVKRWSAGYLQNVLNPNLTATYADSNNTRTGKISVGFGGHTFLRDGEPGEFPYVHSSNGPDELEGHETDTPNEIFPKTLEIFNEPDLKLKNVDGGLKYATWLALCRQQREGDQDADKAAVILVGRLLWTANFNYDQVKGGVPSIKLDQPERLELEVYYKQPDMGDGDKFPDLRQNASANNYSVAELTVDDKPVTKWTFDDEGEPTKYSTDEEGEDLGSTFLPPGRMN